MLVTIQNYEGAIRSLSSASEIALDTETFGLRWNDRLFSLILATEKENFYFNFLNYNQTVHYSDYALFWHLQQRLFNDPSKLWFIHNAKFDMRRLEIEGCSLKGDVWDTQCMERFVRNNYMKYSLEACLERRGWKKDDKVAKYIEEHPKDCITRIKIPGKAKKEVLKHYDKVPFALMYEYGLIDGRETYKLGKDQQAYFAKNPELLPLVENEKKLVKAVFNMESRGIRMDPELCREAMVRDEIVIKSLYEELEREVGLPYKSGPKWLTSVLNDQGVEYATSDKGNPIFDKHALKTMDHSITNKIMEIRHYETRVRTFYSAYLYFADNSSVLHPNFNIAGTSTGRFSSSEPNLQQVPKEEGADPDNTIRQIFKPRPGFIFVMMDYDTMEYRLAADYAGEMEMISAIKGGLDPHTFVANMMGVERKPAKTLNFQNLYGGGIAKLCTSLFKPTSKLDTLKLVCKRHIYNSKRLTAKEIATIQRIPDEALKNDIAELKKAQALQNKYYATLPKLEKLFDNAEKTALSRGYIFNRYRRRIYLDDKKFAYKLVNYLIQGTGADIVRHAIVKMDQLFKDTKSKLILQVHDECLAEIHLSELHLIPKMRKIMEEEYSPINGMNLTVGVDWSDKSWATEDKKEWTDETEAQLKQIYRVEEVA